MQLELYNQIVTSIHKFNGLSKDCAKMLKEKYDNVPINTLFSILSLEIQQKMKINHTKLFGSNKNYYER
ncbi:hypothetical protein M0802_003409 [Mischocyttarus mexicanus]|nr:hypothetical protein M0802_003409 [Mischocyttarus mexicanus]